MNKDSGKILLTIKENGININWKVLLILTTILFGGGATYTGYQLVTKEKLDQAILNYDQRVENRNAKQDETIQQNSAAIVENGKVIGTIRISLDAIQETQHKTIARQEARRVTQTISNRNKREEAYDRIRDINIKRLKKGDDPCLDLKCAQ